jgi:hypothetical protein
VLFGQVLGGDAHMTDAERVGQGADHGIEHLGVAHARAGTHRGGQVGAARHDFDAAADGEIRVAEQDGLGRADDGLLGRTAQAIDGEGDRFHGHAALDRGIARDVGVAGFGRNDVADRGEGDGLGVDAGTGDGLLDHQAAQVGRLHAGQRTAEGAHRGTRRAQYNDFSLVSHQKAPFVMPPAAPGTESTTEKSTADPTGNPDQGQHSQP